MKIKIKSYNAVASWRWNIQPKDKKDNNTVGDESKSKADLSDLDAEVDEDDDDDEEEDVCGICRVAFEGTCPNCKIPGDDCPLIFGKCTHIFHLHCLLTWLNSESSKNQCPLDRQPWVTAGE